MSACNADKLRTLGGIVSAWCLFDRETEDGIIDGITYSDIDNAIGLDGLCAGMESVGWIKCTENGVVLVDFEKHNGNSAKRRGMDASRKGSARKTDNVRTKCGQNADKTRTECGTRVRERVRVISPNNNSEDKSSSSLLVDNAPTPAEESEKVEVEEMDATSAQRQWVAELARQYPDRDVDACLQDFLRFVKGKRGNPSRNGFIGFLAKCSPKIIDEEQDPNKTGWE